MKRNMVKWNEMIKGIKSYRKVSGIFLFCLWLRCWVKIFHKGFTKLFYESYFYDWSFVFLQDEPYLLKKSNEVHDNFLGKKKRNVFFSSKFGTMARSKIVIWLPIVLVFFYEKTILYKVLYDILRMNNFLIGKQKWNSYAGNGTFWWNGMHNKIKFKLCYFIKILFFNFKNNYYKIL